GGRSRGRDRRPLQRGCASGGDHDRGQGPGFLLEVPEHPRLHGHLIRARAPAAPGAGFSGPRIPRGGYGAPGYVGRQWHTRWENAMHPLPVHILRMSRAEMGLAIDWAAREGWNPGRHDADIFHPIDVRGHFMGWVDNQPAACISGLRYGSSYGFIGLYIVQPHLRGRGLGMAVWRAALDHLKGCVVGLDGVVEQQANYRRSGFDLAWHNRRFMTLGRS